MDIQLELSKNVYRLNKIKKKDKKQVHLLVEGGHVASVGGAQDGSQKGGGLHSGKVHPEFRQLSIADNKRRVRA